MYVLNHYKRNVYKVNDRNLCMKCVERQLPPLPGAAGSKKAHEEKGWQLSFNWCQLINWVCSQFPLLHPLKSAFNC